MLSDQRSFYPPVQKRDELYSFTIYKPEENREGTIDDGHWKKACQKHRLQPFIQRTVLFLPVI